MTVDDLIVQAATNPAAFGLLYDRYYSQVYNYMRYRCNDIHTAEDLTARLFERLLTGIASYDPSRGPFEPWLFAIARNQLNDHFRRQALGSLLPWEWFQNKAGCELQPEETALLHEEERELLIGLSRLKPRQRDLLGLRFASGLSHRQIAGLTGLSESNVAVTIHRAIGELREILEPGSEPAPSGKPQKVKHHGS